MEILCKSIALLHACIALPITGTFNIRNGPPQCTSKSASPNEVDAMMMTSRGRCRAWGKEGGVASPRWPSTPAHTLVWGAAAWQRERGELLGAKRNRGGGETDRQHPIIGVFSACLSSFQWWLVQGDQSWEAWCMFVLSDAFRSHSHEKETEEFGFSNRSNTI